MGLSSAGDRRYLDAAAAAVLGALVCLVGVGRPSYWYDEAATLSSVRRPLPDLLRELARVDGVHGLYYLLAKGWTGLLGTSETALRALSALAVGAAAALLLLLVRRLGGGRTLAATSVALLLLVPRVTWAGGEARVFALSIAAGCLLVLVAARLLARPAPWRWVAVAAATTLAVHTFLYLVLLVPVVLLAHLVRPWPDETGDPGPRRRAVPLATATGLGVVLSIPFVLLVLSERDQLRRVPPIGVGTGEAIVTQQWYLLPTTVSSAHLDRTWWLPGGVALAVLLTGLAVLGASTRSRLAVLGVLWALLPMLVVLVSSAVLQPTYTQRYWGSSAPGLALLAALGLQRLASAVPRRADGARAAVAGVLVLAVVCALPGLVAQREVRAKNARDYRSAAQLVEAWADPGEAILFGPNPRHLGTTRSVAAAYPAPFADLRDVGLGRTGAATATLWGTEAGPDETGRRLAGARTVLLLSESDGPRPTPDEGRVLRDGGWRAEQEWRTSVWTLTRYRR